MQDGFKQFCLLWTLLSATAICVLCQQQQQLISTLREGNYTCQGEEVVFTCTVSDSTLPVLVIGWRSDEYIGPDALLQFTTDDMQGENRTSMINENVTAILTRNANDNGVLMVESTLRIVATVPSQVTCGVTDRDDVSSTFSVSAVPGVPQRISAAEISQPRDNLCIILVSWDPPANSGASDVDQYIVYVPSRNIEMTVQSSSSPLTTLTVMNCGDDVRIQVAAMNRFGCGMNSSEVQPILLDDNIVPNATVTVTTGGASPSSQLDVGAIAGIVVAVAFAVCVFFGIGSVCVVCLLRGSRVTEKDRMEKIREEAKETRKPDESRLTIKDSLLSLYFALRPKNKTSDSFITSAMGALRAELKKAKAIDVRDELKSSLEELKNENDEDVQRALDYLIQIFPDMPIIDDDFKSNIKELRDEAKSTCIKDALDEVIDKKVDCTAPDEIQKILLNLCDALFEKFLRLSSKQEAVVRKFEILKKSLEEVESLLTAEFTKGLESEEAGGDVKVKMFVTHVYEMPKGTEEGECLVVDLGVNHLKVLHINIVRGSIKKKDCKEFYIDEDTKNSSYEILFKFIVDRIAKFKKDRNIIDEQLPIGFTFPFPMKHESLTCGKLIRWTRDFKSTGAEGKDVVQLLKDAAKDMQVNVVALINDTTGILLSGGNNCCIGLALGDGANACYMEELSAIRKVKGDRRHTKVIVNTEWGAFGDDGKLDRWRNEYDRDLDDKSSNLKQQFFEKMISNRYQGRIVYLVLNNLISKGELFGGQSSPKFDDFESFSTGRLSTMEGWDMEKCKKLFKNRFDIEASDMDCEVIRRVCVAVSTRAARLAAAGIVALVKKIKKTGGCTVAVDGSTYKRDPFPERLRDALDELAPRNDIKIKQIEDGSSIGAAFAAAMNSPRPSLTPRSISPEAEGSEGPRGQDITGSGTEPTAAAAVKNLNYVNIEDQGRRPPQAQAAGDIELPQIVVDNQ